MLFANVCAGFIRLCYGVGGKRRCLGTLGSPGGSTNLGGVSFPDLPSCVCGTWATQACHSLDTLFGRSSARALSSWFSGSSQDNWEVCHFSCWHHLQYRVLLEVAVYASLSEIAQSP